MAKFNKENSELKTGLGYVRVTLVATKKSGEVVELPLKSGNNDKEFDFRVDIADVLKTKDARKGARVLEKLIADGIAPVLKAEFFPISRVETEDEDDIDEFVS